MVHPPSLLSLQNPLSPISLSIKNVNSRVSNTLPISMATKSMVAVNVKPISQVQMTLYRE